MHEGDRDAGEDGEGDAAPSVYFRGLAVKTSKVTVGCDDVVEDDRADECRSGDEGHGPLRLAHRLGKTIDCICSDLTPHLSCPTLCLCLIVFFRPILVNRATYSSRQKPVG